MCRRVSCDRCGKPTFAGCGAHIEQVLGDVPKALRCRCREEERAGKEDRVGKEQPETATKSRFWPF